MLNNKTMEMNIRKQGGIPSDVVSAFKHIWRTVLSGLANLYKELKELETGQRE